MTRCTDKQLRQLIYQLLALTAIFIPSATELCLSPTWLVMHNVCNFFLEFERNFNAVILGKVGLKQLSFKAITEIKTNANLSHLQRMFLLTSNGELSQSELNHDGWHSVNS